MIADWRWQTGLVSVVVPTYNRAATLDRVLAAFATQSLSPDQFEVIVVDDGSTDATPTTLATAQARLPFRLTALTQANQGPAAARNRGLAAARGAVVVFVDDDCLPTPGLLAAHQAAHEVEGLAVIGRITWHPDLPVTPLMRVLEADTYAYTNIAVPFDASFFCYYTGNASVHRETALAIGGFDESFPHWHEDVEFAFRLRQHGVRFVFANDALVHHWREVDLAATVAAQRAKGRDLVRLFDKHPELRRYLPIERVVDPAVRDEYFRVVLHQALLEGVDDGVAALADDDPLRMRLADEQSRWTERRVSELQAEVARLEAEVARLRQVEAAAITVQSELARLERAYQEQSSWAADLERRLRAKPATGALRSGLDALLAFRRSRGSSDSTAP